LDAPHGPLLNLGERGADLSFKETRDEKKSLILVISLVSKSRNNINKALT
jgi:hypothetical protein